MDNVERLPVRLGPLNVCRNMSQLSVAHPLTFEPIFMERIWGGRRLESEFGKKLPPKVRIGESWEIVDRPEAQSIVRDGPLRGKTLHDLWTQNRQAIFGDVAGPSSPRRVSDRTGIARFPLLVKLLDAQEKLSLQVHPPEEAAKMLASEPKTEFWYVAAAGPDADLFVGLRQTITREEFKHALNEGTVADLVHTIRVRPGDAMFLPAGRLHAVGAGNLLVEIQQNSDTTYRVFDWNRVDEKEIPRQLHIDEALQSVDLNDAEPELVQPRGEVLVQNELFEIQKWELGAPREIALPGQFAIVYCVSGKLSCAGVDLKPGEFFLVPASLQDRQIRPDADSTTLLRVTIPL